LDLENGDAATTSPSGLIVVDFADDFDKLAKDIVQRRREEYLARGWHVHG
jgi:hypothetical protein